MPDPCKGSDQQLSRDTNRKKYVLQKGRGAYFPPPTLLPSYTDTELCLFSFPFSLAKCFPYWTMAVGFVLRWNLRNVFRLHASIAGNLRHPTRIFKANNSLSYKNNRLRRSFHNTSSLFVSGKESSSIDLSGIFPPIVTPFEDDEEVSYAKLEENFRKWNDIPFKGKVVLF